jgi:hypothetical protein
MLSKASAVLASGLRGTELRKCTHQAKHHSCSRQNDRLRSFIPSTASRSLVPAEIQAWGYPKSTLKTSLCPLKAGPRALEDAT